MTAISRLTRALLAVLALRAVLAAPAGAQVGKLIDPNMAAESELRELPFMTPAIVTGMLAPRPVKTVVELNKVLLGQKLTNAQAREFYPRAFVPINFNTGPR